MEVSAGAAWLGTKGPTWWRMSRRWLAAGAGLQLRAGVLVPSCAALPLRLPHSMVTEFQERHSKEGRLPAPCSPPEELAQDCSCPVLLVEPFQDQIQGEGRFPASRCQECHRIGGTKSVYEGPPMLCDLAKDSEPHLESRTNIFSSC